MKRFLILSVVLFLVGALWFGCSKDRNPLPSNTHPETWTQEEAPEFHGKKVLTVGYASCTSCHGFDLLGGEAGVSCYSCHEVYPHKQGWTSPGADDFHGAFIAAQNWSMEKCKTCHGSDYRGGETDVSCYKCHTSEAGPEACNTCHGNQDNAAPPKDLSNNVETTAIGVGAHQLHVALFKGCSICHITPTAFSDSTHIDGTPYAEVVETWGWDRNTATCANACHGDPNKSYIWNNF